MIPGLSIGNPLVKLAAAVILALVVLSALLALGLGAALGLSFDYALLGPERFQDLLVCIGLVVAGAAVLLLRLLAEPWRWLVPVALFGAAGAVWLEVV